MTALLGIDPGTATGCALARDDGTSIFGSQAPRARLSRANGCTHCTRSITFARVACEEPYQSPYVKAVRSLFLLAGGAWAGPPCGERIYRGWDWTRATWRLRLQKKPYRRETVS
jgi:hypothetical protein